MTLTDIIFGIMCPVLALLAWAMSGAREDRGEK